MVDVPSSIGWMTVTMNAIATASDSTDTGSAPDAFGLNGTVVFQPVGIPRGFLVNGLDCQFVVPRTVTGILRNGLLYAPANGIAPASPGEVPTGSPGLSLVAPQQAAFDTLSWYWLAKVIPAASEGGAWPTFAVSFTGVPGTTICLANESLKPVPGTAIVPQPKVWVQAGTSIPAGAVSGQFLLDTNTMILYQIGA